MIHEPTNPEIPVIKTVCSDGGGGLILTDLAKMSDGLAVSHGTSCLV